VAPPSDVTGLLQAWSDGDLHARDRLVPIVYAELRRRAAVHLRRERADHTLQPTALVHEAYLRLVNQDRAQWRNRAQFFAVASEIMRRILVDRARARRMAKRSGRWERVSLVEDAAVTSPHEVDVLDLDLALTELAAFDARKARAGGPGRCTRHLARHDDEGLAGGARVAVQAAEPWQGIAGGAGLASHEHVFRRFSRSSVGTNQTEA
jgi:RNA polymerase sigma factor (TIGR02999 family)